MLKTVPAVAGSGLEYVLAASKCSTRSVAVR